MSRLTSLVPALGWLPRWREGLLANAVAALAVWAVLVPQAMGYAELAGVPPVHGLYAAFAALVAYAILGTSGVLNVGPSSGVAVLSASTVAPLAAGDGARAIVLSAVLALLTGLILVAAGLARLGLVAEFFARPVLVGYAIGLGLVIVIGQVPALIGLASPSGGFLERAAEILRSLPDADPPTAAVGLCSLAAVLVLGKVAPRVPGGLLVVIAGVALSRLLDLEARGVAVLGDTPAGLPDLGFPDVRRGDVELLVAGALGLAVLSYTESIAAARRYATGRSEAIDANKELVAVGVSNVAASAVQGFAVDASMSRTTLAAESGQRTQLAGLLSAALVGLTLLFLTGYFADLPVATLAAVVIAAVLPLLRTGALRRLQRLDDVDFAFAAICLLGVLVFGPLEGILIAVLASLVALVIRSYRPHTAVLGRVPGGGEGNEDFGFRDVSRHDGLETYPGLVIFRFDQEIFFANASRFRDALLAAVDAETTPVREVLVDSAAISHVDTTGLEMLADLDAELAARGITLCLARVKSVVRESLERAGLTSLLGPDGISPSLHVGVARFLEADSRRSAPPR